MWGQQLGYFLPLVVIFGIVGVVGRDEVASSGEYGLERASNLRKYHYHHHLLFGLDYTIIISAMKHSPF